MSYTREAVSETSAAVPTMPIPAMREDRVIDPYQTVKRLPTAQAAVAASGQSDISSEAAEPAKTEETVTLSPHMAALARKEQKYRQQQLALKADKEAIEKERAELAELRQLKENLSKGDYTGVDKLIDYEKFTQKKLEDLNSLDPNQQAVKELKGEVEQIKKAHQDDVSKRYEAAVNERRTAVKALVDSKPEFSGIKKLEMQEAVVQHILDTWEQDGSELTPEQAAKEVSEILKEKAKSWASILEEPKVDVVDEKKSLPPLKQGIKTLTNNMAPVGEMKRPPRSFQGMSDQERYAEARRRAEERIKLQRG